MNKKFFFVTAEKSGNDIAFPIIEELAKQGHKISGVGDDRFYALDTVEIVKNSDELAVMGIWEVLKQYKRIKKNMDDIINAIIEQKPDMLLLFDAPSLNFRITEAVRKKIDVKVLGIVSPAVWMWKYKRIFTIKRLYNAMACIMPFEKPLYDEIGMKSEYIGHPLITNFEMDFSKTVEEEVIGVLPGSREQEIHAHLLKFRETIEYFQSQGYKGKFLISKMPHFADSAFSPVMGLDNVEFETENSKRLMEKSSFLFVKSGTVTLEALMSKRPFLVFYKTSPLTAFMFKTFIQKDKFKGISLPNIIANDEVIPEFVQDWDVREVYKKYIQYTEDKNEFTKLYNIVINELGKKDYIQESCKLIKELI